MVEKYVVWECHDPRIVGDNSSEVYNRVYMIDSKEECMEFYNGYKATRRWAGQSSVYYTYPQPLQGDLKVGDKKVIHAGRSHISPEEEWEIEQGY